MFTSDSQHPPRSRHAVYLGVTDELSIEANSVDPEKTLFAIEASETFQQTRKADDFCCNWCIKGFNQYQNQSNR